MFAAAFAALLHSLGGDGLSDCRVRRLELSKLLSSSSCVCEACFLDSRGEHFGKDEALSADDASEGGDGGAQWRANTIEVGNNMIGGKLDIVGGSNKMPFSVIVSMIVDIR